MPPSDSTGDAKRPLALAAILLCMIFVLVYVLITFPPPMLTERLHNTARLQPTASPASKEISTTVADPYRFAGQPFHRHQIPDIVRPSLYRVRLKIYLPWRPGITFGARDFTLDGMTHMEFTVCHITKRVQLNTKNLNITVTRLYMGTEEIPIHEISNNFPQLLDIYSSCDLLPNHNYTLALEFRTNINNPKYAGIFSAPYKHGSENRFKTATHLQPQEARSLFPCIDSPEAKAMFQAVIVHPVGTYALFNMKEANVTTEGGWTTTTFLRSPKMSTYLFAVVVGTMPYQETYTERGVRIRIYAEAEKLRDTTFALALVPRLLAFFEDYFQLPYPLEKLGRIRARHSWNCVKLDIVSGGQAKGISFFEEPPGSRPACGMQPACSTADKQNVIYNQNAVV